MTKKEWIDTLTSNQKVKLLRTFSMNSCCMCVDYRKPGEQCGDCFEGQSKWMETEYSEDDIKETPTRYNIS